MSYAIEVRRVAVVLHMEGGRQIDGRVFVHDVGAHDLRPETVVSRLNDAESAFLPVQTTAAGGSDATEAPSKVILVRIGSIAWLELAETPPEVCSLEEVGGSRKAVEILLSTGHRLQGDLLYQAPEGKNRVLDLLNARGDRFLLLATGAGYALVRRDAIEQVIN